MGNTAFSTVIPPSVTVHPHACGEHFTMSRTGDLAFGSSPRLWGTHRHARLTIFAPRFIPTPVGNTTRGLSRVAGQTVHPHACGEHSSTLPLLLTSSGSSPRLWGTHLEPQEYQAQSRFIPTPVGNTFILPGQGWYAAVHPHACGEHKSTMALMCLHSGSSPRLWGTRIVLICSY